MLLLLVTSRTVGAARLAVSPSAMEEPSQAMDRDAHIEARRARIKERTDGGFAHDAERVPQTLNQR